MECISTIFVEHNDTLHEVPCGKCAFCQMNRRSDWMFRIHYEMRNQQYPGWFLTLTYSEKKVPRLKDRRLTLKFRHVQLFLKKLRKQKYYAKYVCVGEYGPETERPHYHMLLWTDANSDELERIWSKGHIYFGSLTMASAMYTLKYIIQIQMWPSDEGREKPRAQYSKGLGISYLGQSYRDGIQVYNYHNPEFGEKVFYSYIGEMKVALPRYYRDKIFTKHEKRMEAEKMKVSRETEKQKELQVIRDLGIADPERYLLSVRTDIAAQLKKKVKHNQKL